MSKFAAPVWILPGGNILSGFYNKVKEVILPTMLVYKNVDKRHEIGSK